MKKRITLFLICLALLFPNSITFADSVYNKDIFDYTNITQWHQYGYTGKGVKIVVSDKGQIDFRQPFINDKKLIDYYGNINSKYAGDDHIQKVVQVLQQVAPDATIILVSNSTFGDAVHVAVKENAQILTMSTSYYSESVLSGNNDIIRQAYNKNIFMNSSAGNNRANITIESPYWFTTGAVRLINGQPIKADYSSYGDDLDFMGFTDIRVWQEWYGKYGVYDFGGTSSSAPMVSGMTALYYEYYKEKVGKFPTIEEAEEFITKNCMDLDSKGYDIYTGHGLFILPKLNLRDEIIVEKSNPLAIKTKKPDGRDWYVHINWIEEYLGRGYRLRR